MKCAVGPRREDSRAVNAYKRFLEWDIVKGPKSVKVAERVLSPVLGKKVDPSQLLPGVQADLWAMVTMVNLQSRGYVRVG